MNIIYTCDNNFVWIMGISMISLFENNKDCKDINVYLLGDHVSEESKKTLDSIALKYQRHFTLIDVPDLNIPEKLSSARWPKSAFTRMFAGELLPEEVTKAIYLDCDTIISGNIHGIEAYIKDNMAISGVKDCVSRPYKAKIGIGKDGSYINAGVLAMNIKKLREFDIRKMIADFVDKYEPAISYADQDILNGIFKGKFGILPPQYDLMTMINTYTYKKLQQIRHPHNYYSAEEIEFSKKNPLIIHFTTAMLNIRPWCEGSKHSYAWMFEKYQAMSPWAARQKGKANFSANEYKIIRKILMLPKPLAYRLLGLIHAYLRPYYIIATSNIKRYL